MFTTGILADIWNVVDFGIEESLDLIQSVGAQSISLRVTSSRVSQLRAGEFDGPRMFRSDGGYFFQPDKSKYANTRIKPVVASWLKSRDPLEKIAESCRKRDLELRLRISALEHPLIASRYPEGVTKSVFGDSAPETLSAANPDVVELLRATACDLTSRCPKSAIELEEICFRSGARESDCLQLGPDFDDGFFSLLALSFDESSRQFAIRENVDVDAVSRWISVTLEKALSDGHPVESLHMELMEESPILKSFVHSQIDAVTILVSQVETAIENALSVVFCGQVFDGSFPRVDCDALKNDRSVIIQSQDGFVHESQEGSEFFWGIENLSNVHTARQTQMSTIPWDVPERLVSEVKSYADSGLSGVVLAGFGLFPQSGFDVIKRAFRFASRSSQ